MKAYSKRYQLEVIAVASDGTDAPNITSKKSDAQGVSQNSATQPNGTANAGPKNSLDSDRPRDLGI